MAMIRLSDAIENLRAELSLAHEMGKDQDIMFNLEEIELELDVVAETEGSTSAKVKWFVFSGGVEGKMKNAKTHKIKLNLQAVNKEGQSLRISRTVKERPE